MRFMNKVVALRPGEGPTALLMFTYSFLAMTSYNIVKPVTQSKFIDGLGALYVPFADLGAGIAIGIVMQGYLQATGRLPRRSIIPTTLAGLAVALGLFWVLFQSGSESVAVAFYVFGRLFGILVISQFWTLANEVYDARQARRLFGFIGGGSSLGGVLGGVTTAFMAGTVGTTNLLLVSALVLLVCMGIVTVIARRQPEAAACSSFSAIPSGALNCANASNATVSRSKQRPMPRRAGTAWNGGRYRRPCSRTTSSQLATWNACNAGCARLLSPARWFWWPGARHPARNAGRSGSAYGAPGPNLSLPRN